MKDHPLRATAYHFSLVIAGIFAVGVQAADITGREEIIEATLNECAKNTFDQLSGWQRIQMVLASRDDWVEICGEQIQSDLRAGAERDYKSGNATDQSFRQQMDEISKHVSSPTAADVGGGEYGRSSAERFVVVDGDGRSQRSVELAREPAVETIPGYETISK